MLLMVSACNHALSPVHLARLLLLQIGTSALDECLAAAVLHLLMMSTIAFAVGAFWPPHVNERQVLQTSTANCFTGLLK